MTYCAGGADDAEAGGGTNCLGGRGCPLGVVVGTIGFVVGAAGLVVATAMSAGAAIAGCCSCSSMFTLGTSLVDAIIPDEILSWGKIGETALALEERGDDFLVDDEAFALLLLLPAFAAELVAVLLLLFARGLRLAFLGLGETTGNGALALVAAAETNGGA